MSRHVVITGIGCVSALGVGLEPLWEGLCHGRTALGPITRFDASTFRARLAGEIKDFAARDFVPKSYRKAVKVMCRDIEIAVAAAHLAVQDAGLRTRAATEDATETGQNKTTYPSDRMGCHIGAGLIAADTEELSLALATARSVDGGGVDLAEWGRAGMENLTPLWMLKYLPNMPACHVTIIHGAEGPSNTITCDEASGLLSIGESTRIIQRDAADLCFAGGAESRILPMGLIRLDLMGRLAPTGDSQDGADLVRPYDGEATGSVVGEGGGLVILEHRESAALRNARIYAQVAGFGSSQSATSFYDKGENDDGVRFAILNALDDASCRAEDIDAIVPTASGIPCMDRAEMGALKAVFGDHLASAPLITMTPNIGLCMAGLGGLQAAIAAKCLQIQTVPARVHRPAPTPNGASRSDAACPPFAQASPSRPADLRTILVLSCSLGGQNAALVLRRS